MQREKRSTYTMRLHGLWRRMVRVYHSISLKKKLPIMLCIQILVPLLVISSLSYLISARAIRDKSINHSGNLLGAMKHQITNYTQGLELISQSILYERKIYEVLTLEDTSQDSLTYYELSGEVTNIFKRLILTRSEVQAIHLVAEDMHAYISENTGKTSERTAVPYDAISEAARKKQGEVVWFVDAVGGKVRHIYLARIVYNQNNFREIGLLVIEAKMEYLRSLSAGLISQDIHGITILSENNEEIVRVPEERAVPIAPDIAREIRGKEGSYLDKQNDMLVTFVSVGEPGWAIFSEVSRKELYREIDMLRHWIFLLCGISVLVLTACSLLITVDFLSPINLLVNAMERLGQKGELQGVPVNRGDELGFLEESFNTMVDEINYLIKWNYQERITRKEAELKTLQAQINPHFLFNTLESINWMAQMNGVQSISDMVTSLSKLMEANIVRDDKLITLEEEVTYLTHYIAILKYRFGDRINLVRRVDAEVAQLRIPKLLIQPLVENAVYHGIEKKKGRDRGVILLRAFRAGEQAVIEVIDNGAGMPAEEVSALNDMLAQKGTQFAKTPNPRQSIGLGNVNQRIKLFYGPTYGLTLSSREGCYTKISMCLPMKAPAQDGRKEA